MFEINTVLFSITLFQVIKSVSLLLGMIGLGLNQGLKMCILYGPGSTGSLVLLWGFRGSGIDLAPRGSGIGLDLGAPGIVVNLVSV